MKAIILSMKGSERISSVVDMFKKQDVFFRYEVFEAINGKAIDVVSYYKMVCNWVLKKKDILSPSELGCSLSHIEMMRKGGFSSPILFVEDDILEYKSLSEKDYADICALAKYNSIIFMGGMNGCGRERLMGKRINSSSDIYYIGNISAKMMWRTCCYIASPDVQEKYVKFQVEQGFLRADCWADFFRKERKIKVYYIDIFSHPTMCIEQSSIEEERALKLRFRKRPLFLKKIFRIFQDIGRLLVGYRYIYIAERF